jgi:hypothetical protein
MTLRVQPPVLVLLVLALGAALSACGLSSRNTQAAQMQKIGCNFDSAKVCQQALARGKEFTSGITTSNQSYFQQNSPATDWLQVPVRAPGGSEVDVQCQIKTEDNQVIYAYPAVSGSVSDSDREWLKQVGYCAGIPGTTTPPPVRAEG